MTARAEYRTGLRVAQITPSLRGGGLERLVRDLTMALTDRGHQAEVFCTGGLGTYAGELEAAGIEVHDSRDGTFRLRGYPATLIRDLRNFAPDVIHAHSGSWLAAAVAKSRLRTPRLVFTDHGRYPPEPWMRAKIERWCRSRTDGLVAVTPALAQYDRKYLRLEEDPAVILNGIDLSPFEMPDADRRADRREEWGIAPDEIAAIAVGRMAPVKNYSGMLRALASARLTAPALRLVILGAGPEEDQIRAQAESSGMGQAVVFAGFRRDVVDCLCAADIFVNFSHTEALPVSLLEAMAAGLPTVAPGVGGIPHALGEPAAGIIVPPGDEAAFSEALSRLALDAELRGRLGALARNHAERFSLETFVTSYCSLYESVLEARQ